MDKLLTVNEVADVFSLKVKTVYELAAKGVIPSKKIGKHRRFDRQELETWLKRNRGK